MVSKAPSKALALIPSKNDVRQKVADAILGLVVRVPPTREQALDQPQARAEAIGRSAARQASVLASSMALPPGFLGWLTVLPELVGVWKLQTQMVSDIAGVYGKSATMGREQMMYCLFKHVSAQLFRDVVVRVGERFLIQRASSAFLQSVVQKLGIKLTQSMVGKGVSRFVPLIGAVGVGAYAYFDTRQVARTAIELFSSDIVVEDKTMVNPEI
jgi:hypothetical protein